MERFMYLLGMLGGIAMAIVVPLVLVAQCGFDKQDSLLFEMIISVVSISCGFALCRHCLIAASGSPSQTDEEES